MALTYKERVDAILYELKAGARLLKRKHNGEKYSRHFFLHEHEDFVSYQQSEKLLATPRCYAIQKIDEVRPGFHTRTFNRLLRHQIVEPNDEYLSFSIIYNNYRDELHLMANDERTRDMWVQGLQHLINENAQKEQRHVICETSWILKHFRAADKDQSGTLTKRECRRLLTDSLNANVPEQVFETLFKQADRSGEGVLSPDEFVTFFHLLTRRKDLYEIMQKYVKNGYTQSVEMIQMNVDELLDFLQTCQHQNIASQEFARSDAKVSYELIETREQAQKLIDQFEMNVELRENGLLSFDGFRNMMLSSDFDLMKPSCSRQPYQNMTRPLTDYYINTSHNTYLFNTQLSGDSNPEAYNRALRVGCRAVELDCYDGDNGRPIVKHAYTLVKPCLFETIIRLMKPNLFSRSPYPVILDLENHCSLEQQNEMARILQRTFGDQLISEPLSADDPSVLPSPEDLKYKVLVRGIKVPTPTTILKLMKEEKDDDRSLFHPQSKEVQRDLADLFIYLQNVPYREYEYAKAYYSCFHSPNIAENHLGRVARDDPVHLVQQSARCLCRMYPSGLRQGSSNPDPIFAWNFGVQMVALNYQNSDAMMALCYGKFLDNGGCGYVLKPKYLIDAERTLFNPSDYRAKLSLLSTNPIEQPQHLIITIISAQFLSRSSATSTDIPDPYVVVSTHGIPCDQQVQRTSVVNNNGFDPTWNETFEFQISFPQMCLVQFTVYDQDTLTRDDRLVHFCLPLTTMQTGFRHIRLKANNNDSTYSTLFVHVQIEGQQDESDITTHF